MKCIIAEKPSVANEIAKIVGATSKKEGYIEGNGYIVTWAYGHLIELAFPDAYGYKEYKAEDLPIIPSPFKLEIRKSGREIDRLAQKQLGIISKCFDASEIIIVATDAGREGELIFRYIYHYLRCKTPFERLWISSLTEKSIRDGLRQLKDGRLYDNLYFSAKARSEADWIVGINASRALSISQGAGGYSLGRVQTPTLGMICSRFIENRDFKVTPYWKVAITLENDHDRVEATSLESCLTKERAEEALKQITNSNTILVSKVESHEVKVPPPLLYDITTLQKEANKRFSFTADKTLSLAQSLYEKKVTTYPRTGSRYIGRDDFETIPELLKIHNLTDGGVMPSSLSLDSVDDSKVTDHHAIIITENIADSLSSDEEKIYNMIRLRMQEAFNAPCLEQRMSITFCSENESEYIWRGKLIKVKGWKAINTIVAEDNDLVETQEELTHMPHFEEGLKVSIIKRELTQHLTKPKPIHSEASLLGAMESAGKEVEDREKRKALSECGIGTPATRASIIEQLITRGYIERQNKKLLPTEKGLFVYGLTKDKKIGNVEMSGSWEVGLNAIERGEMDETSFASGIRIYTTQICEELLTTPSRQEDIKVCPKCGKHSVVLYNKVAKCTEKECDFRLFRLIAGKKLTESDVFKLLTEGKTGKLKGFKSKAGKSFDAQVVLDDNWKMKFLFASTQKSNSQK